MARDFVGYGKNPPKVEWPNGARVAVNIVINYEEGAERNPLDGDPQRETAAEHPFPLPPEERDLGNESIYEFGSRVGVWRLLRILDKYEVKATIFACGRALERNREVAREFTARGHDIVGHGYRWQIQWGMDLETEREEIRRAVQSIQETTGQRIEGWFARHLRSLNTRQILLEQAFLYDSTDYSDEIPYFTDINGQRLLIVPYSIEANDIRFWRGTFLTAEHFYQYMRDTFDCLYEEGATNPRMMSVGLHCRIVGRPGRAMALDRFLQYARGFPRVWFARRNDIAHWWLERYG